LSEVLSFIAENWVKWLFAAVSTLLAWGYRSIARQLEEEREKNRAIANGVQALLRESIVGSYNKWTDRGYCPIYAKESLKLAYKSYHALGGNDVATELYNKALRMPEEVKDETDK
jgi:hypothetical protein